MNNKVQRYVSQCLPCQSFSEKKTAEPTTSHNVPSKCWKQVAVDLFGPMLSFHHVVVVQGMASRYPAAKLVSSTKAAKVLPALRDIYNEYGSPECQLSDNGPPFNSSAMETFAKTRDIEFQKIPPLHPSINPVEIFMKPLEKTMKTTKQSSSLFYIDHSKNFQGQNVVLPSTTPYLNSPKYEHLGVILNKTFTLRSQIEKVSTRNRRQG